MPSLYDIAKHERLISRATTELKRCETVSIAWLEGALARGVSDRYTPVDIHAGIDDSLVESFNNMRVPILRRLGCPLTIRELQGNRLTIEVLYDSGINLHLTTEKLSHVSFRPREFVRVLFDKESFVDSIIITDAPKTPPEFYKELIYRDIAEFWQKVSNFPREIRRGSSIALCQSEITPLRELTARMVVLANDISRVSPDGSCDIIDKESQELERTAIKGASLIDIWHALIETCRLYSKSARRACHKLDLRYPQEIESGIRTYVKSELNDKLPVSEWWEV